MVRLGGAKAHFLSEKILRAACSVALGLEFFGRHPINNGIMMAVMGLAINTTTKAVIDLTRIL